MACNTSMYASREACPTCQYWQGERQIKMTPTLTIVQYRGGCADCVAFRQKRMVSSGCPRYQRWIELP